jgi:HAMP domain-containing protein
MGGGHFRMKISLKLILGLLAIVLLMMIVGGFGIYSQDKIIADNIINIINYEKQMFLGLEERDTTILASTLEVIIQDKTFKEIYLEKNREKLYNYGQPLFQNLKNKYGITHFYFILPDGTNFVRLHNKDIYGDLIARYTFLKARDTKKLGTGIELGKTSFALRAVMPYYNGSELIGYVELGQEVDHFLRVLKGGTGNEFAILADKKSIDHEEWKAVRQAEGLRDNWDDIKDHVLLSATKEDAPATCFVEENIEQVEKGETLLQQIKVGDKTFACGGFVIEDAEGKHVGAVMSLTDITENVALAEKIKELSLIIMVICFLLALGLGLFVTHSISKPIEQITKNIDDISKGRLDIEITGKERKDEIGDLARAFERTIVSLKLAMKKAKAVEEKPEEKKPEEKFAEAFRTKKE